MDYFTLSTIYLHYFTFTQNDICLPLAKTISEASCKLKSELCNADCNTESSSVGNICFS